jgi:short-subunit dehydrogenase
MSASLKPIGGTWAEAYGPFAVITGASEGIGTAFAREAAKRGLDLVLIARRRERLEALAAELRAEHGISAIVLPLDLARPDSTAEIERATAGLDIGLFVAAAGFGTSGPFLDVAAADELDMIDVNCRAVVAQTHLIAGKLKARGRGGIVLFSSIVAFQGVPRSANYAATKAFIQTFAEGLRVELKPHGVHVIACAPGPVESGFAKRAGLNPGAVGKASEVAVETLDALGKSGTVRPGLLSKLLGYSLSTLPRFGRVLVMTQIMAGMTKPSGKAS